MEALKLFFQILGKFSNKKIEPFISRNQKNHLSSIIDPPVFGWCISIAPIAKFAAQALVYSSLASLSPRKSVVEVERADSAALALVVPTSLSGPPALVRDIDPWGPRASWVDLGVGKTG